MKTLQRKTGLKNVTNLESCMKYWAPSEAKNEKSKNYCEADQNVFCHKNISAGHTSLRVYRYKPEDGWYGQPKYCYEKTIHVFLSSFAVVFGLLVFGS